MKIRLLRPFFAFVHGVRFSRGFLGTGGSATTCSRRCTIRSAACTRATWVPCDPAPPATLSAGRRILRPEITLRPRTRLPPGQRRIRILPPQPYAYPPPQGYGYPPPTYAQPAPPPGPELLPYEPRQEVPSGYVLQSRPRRGLIIGARSWSGCPTSSGSRSAVISRTKTLGTSARAGGRGSRSQGRIFPATTSPSPSTARLTARFAPFSFWTVSRRAQVR